MTVLIKNATITDKASAFHNRKADILIENGIIKNIAEEIESTGATKIIEGKELNVAPGFTDIFAHFNDPGTEYKETLETGAQAAATGGYVRSFAIPNTNPVIHNKSQVEYIVQKAKSLVTDIIPIGAITKNAEGKDLAEMYDMQQSGAVAFSDGTHTLQNSQVLLKALQYVKVFDGVIIQIPDDTNITKTGLINEGIVSTQLGLPGKPAIGEQIQIARDLELARYTDSHIHFTSVSTAASVALIRNAKAAGIKVSCSVTPYHLTFTDDDLRTYDTNLKVNTPLRTAEDVAALKAAIMDGTIDCIASHHLPQDYDNKICEFEYAKYGMEGLETTVAAVKTAIPELSNEQLVQLFAVNPATIFKIELPAIAVGSKADLSLWQATGWEVKNSDIRSACKNNSFIGRTLNIKIKGIVNGNKIHIND
ncbi:dihydroorotase [Polluticaenibacter yanchengensis]|uniref:Dihydroorotase n=1 Tax=Polluticaenibacter yanchengensis TaxID=3014562 RepID=A0ABT4UGI5_9BACT|nr:dihydroorotase [Chitinophagaceae bacterium LY-5]